MYDPESLESRINASIFEVYKGIQKMPTTLYLNRKDARNVTRNYIEIPMMGMPTPPLLFYSDFGIVPIEIDNSIAVGEFRLSDELKHI